MTITKRDNASEVNTEGIHACLSETFAGFGRFVIGAVESGTDGEDVALPPPVPIKATLEKGQAARYLNGAGACQWSITSDKTGLCLAAEGEHPQPFVLCLDLKQSHATLLGEFEHESGYAKVPALLLFPGKAAFLITGSEQARLRVTSRRYHLEKPYLLIEFLPKAALGGLVEFAIQPVDPGFYDRESTAAEPAEAGVRNLDLLSFFQMNPHLGMIANNSASDSCAFTLFEAAEIAAANPVCHLPGGLPQILCATLDRYLDGAQGYGMTGYGWYYKDADSVAWGMPYNSLDAHPSLLISCGLMIRKCGLHRWGADRWEKILSLYETMERRVDAETGLLAYEASGDSGSWKPGQRPANWWDCIGFGHLDAFSNALAYRAYLELALAAEAIGRQPDVFRARAGQIQSAYLRTFRTPEGRLAGWKSRDGALHDYQFVFVPSMSVAQGVIDGEEARSIMALLLQDMRAKGVDFSRGIPGNLLPVRREDYLPLKHRNGYPEEEDGSDAFGLYENGGLSACWTFYFIEALFRVGLVAEAEQIGASIMKSLQSGFFMGTSESGLSYDWRDWEGRPCGYEGFLADNFMLPLAFITRGTMAPEPGRAVTPPPTN